MSRKIKSAISIVIIVSVFFFFLDLCGRFPEKNPGYL